MSESLFNKVAGLRPATLLKTCNFIKKETQRKVFSCEFCEIFKNTFFIEHLRWLLLTGVTQKKSCCKVLENLQKKTTNDGVPFSIVAGC